jgi:hypothetical protein
MIDIDKLEALAKAATPGEWISYTPIGAALNPWEATFVAGPIPRYMDRSQGFCPADGNYIGAANPQVVLALIAEVRALREIQAANVEIKMALNVEAQRYRWFRDWFLRGGLRMEIDPVGHIRVTTPDIVDAAIDAARGAK